VTSGTVVPTSKILDVDIKTGEKFYIRIDYDQTTSSEPPVRAYYSDETYEALRSVVPNTTYELTAVKDIVGLGIYLNGTYPTGTMILRCYTYSSAVNINTFINDVNSEIDSIDQKLSDIRVSETQGMLTGETIDGKFINANGIISDGAGNYHILKIVASAGTKYYITGSTNWGNPFFAYYDTQMNLLQKSAGSTSGSTYETITDFESVAPTNSAYLCVNYSGTSTQATVKTSTGYIIAKWSGIKWACVGDSLTDDNQYTEKHYFDFIAEKTGIEPVNMGDSGTGYKRGYDSNRAFYQRIQNIDTNVDVVTIFGSFNDIGAGYDLGTYTDTGTTTIAGCINTTIDNLQTIMPTVVLGIVAPTPWATARPDFHTSADNYVNMLKKIAEHRSIPYLDLFRCSNLRPWDEDFRLLCYSNDGGSGVHPNELGHKIIAPKFEAFLDSLLLH
jgi:lysophospholipase L1-like esterase